MTWLDYAVIGVILGSIAWGVWRGLVRETLSLAGWVIAFLAANLFAGPVGEGFTPSMRPELRVLYAWLAIFVLTLAATTLAALLLSKIVKVVGLGGLDRLLGALFGLARGLLIVVAFALAAGLTSLPRKAVWLDSACGNALAQAALALKPWLPPAFADRLKYN